MNSIGVFVAWPYANGRLHLGHIAGAYLTADIFARYNRLRGRNVLMVSGSDAHGTPITLKAIEDKTEPFDVVLKYHKQFLEDFQKLGISFDLFTHTHTKNHIEIAQDFFKTFLDKGLLKSKEEEQLFDPIANLFLPDRYVVGTCPKCGNENARGDQCENCGATYEASDLIDPRSKISDGVPELRKTTHYYFDMSSFSEELHSYIKDSPHWRAHVRKFTMSALEEGLGERPITRDVAWGVPVPIEGWEDEKVLYVWFEAVIGYFSASVEWANITGGNWEDYWKGSDARGYYFIGKDNVPFHSIFWPVEILAKGDGLNLPYDVPANQFLNIDGEKFSTSRGLGVWVEDVLKEIDADAVRYYLASIFPESKDSNFTWKGLVNANNGELAAAWGNLINRVLGFCYKKFDKKIPTPGVPEDVDKQAVLKVASHLDAAAKKIEAVELREALKEVMTGVREVNKYLDREAPWRKFKSDPDRTATVLFTAISAIERINIALSPWLPHSAEKIHQMLGGTNPLFGELYTEEGDQAPVLRYKHPEVTGDRWEESSLAPELVLEEPQPLFKQLDLEELEPSVED